MRKHESIITTARPKPFRTASVSLKALTKSRLCQKLKKPARQGSKIAKKGVYTDVNDRVLQSLLTQQAKIPANFLSFAGIFAFAGFVSGLSETEAISYGFGLAIFIFPHDAKHHADEGS